MVDFSWIQWTPEQMRAAAEAALAHKKESYEHIKAIPADQRTFANTIGALEWANDRVADITQIAELLLNVHPDVMVRDAAQTVAELIDRENIKLEYDRDLWRAVQEWRTDSEQISDSDKKLYEDTVRDMRRRGFALPDNQFARLKQLTEELQKTEQEFERTINDYQDHIELTREQLTGLSDRYIDGLKRTDDGKYIVSLQYPDLFPFMELAENDAARRELASKNLRKGGQENLERLARMIILRQTIAGMLGYSTHADFAEEIRMSKTAATVQKFLNDLATRLAPSVEKELQDLVAIKQRTLGLKKPSPIEFHEGAFWSTKLKKERYNFDPEILKEYFPLARVLEGILNLYQKLLGVRFEKVSDVSLWYPDAQLYAVHDAHSQQLIGHFILDLYPRPGKYGHAAAFSPILGRINNSGERTTGLMALVCNFPKPTTVDPSLMAHDQVETLLHEFGHICHGLLSSGMWQHQNGLYVPLDFVEALSQFFEHWAWDARSLAPLSGHYRTGRPIPQDLLEKLFASRTHQQARYYTAQATRALYDLRIHSQLTNAPVNLEHLAQLYRDMWLQYEHVLLPDDAIFAAGWGHMGDYDAGYYSYLWSKVYADDMYTRFANNPLDTEVGRQYRDRVLAPGASCPEQQLIEDFLGRPSTNDAFLKQLGIY